MFFGFVCNKNFEKPVKVNAGRYCNYSRQHITNAHLSFCTKQP